MRTGAGQDAALAESSASDVHRVRDGSVRPIGCGSLKLHEIGAESLRTRLILTDERLADRSEGAEVLPEASPPRHIEAPFVGDAAIGPEVPPLRIGQIGA